jgi:ribosomal protein S18 acetylase RimI-like enzyme
MSKMVEIRLATASDVALLVPLVAEYWRFESIPGIDPKRVATQLTRLLSAPQLGAGWIATVEGVVAGYLLAVYVFSLEHLGLTAEIDEFFVLPSQRDRGAGATLLRVAEAEFLRAGCTNVSLQLSRSNEAARGFYRRHAYSERSGYELLDKRLDER